MARFALLLALFAASCAGATVKLVPNDSGPDAGADAAIDAGVDAAVEAGPSCACTSGPCCDGCNVVAVGTRCGPGVATGQCLDTYTLLNATFYQACDGVTANGCGGAWTPDPTTSIHTTCNGCPLCGQWACGGGGATFPQGACCVSPNHMSCN